MRTIVLILLTVFITGTALATEPEYEEINDLVIVNCTVDEEHRIYFTITERSADKYKVECQSNSILILFEDEKDFSITQYRFYFDDNHHTWTAFTVRNSFANHNQVIVHKGEDLDSRFNPQGERKESYLCPGKDKFCRSKKYNWLLKQKKFMSGKEIQK